MPVARLPFSTSFSVLLHSFGHSLLPSRSSINIAINQSISHQLPSAPHTPREQPQSTCPNRLQSVRSTNCRYPIKFTKAPKVCVGRANSACYQSQSEKKYDGGGELFTDVCQTATRREQHKNILNLTFLQPCHEILQDNQAVLANSPPHPALSTSSQYNHRAPRHLFINLLAFCFFITTTTATITFVGLHSYYRRIVAPQSRTFLSLVALNTIETGST